MVLGVLEYWSVGRTVKAQGGLIGGFLLLHRSITPDFLLFACEYYLAKSIDSFKLVICLSGGLVDVRGSSIWRKTVQGECG